MKSILLPKTYTPTDYEEDIYYKWESSGYFNPDNLPGKRKKVFSISLPPPNVTGKLHIGHVVMLAYQDIIIRYHRLKGEKTLWLPGMDHAAIATQSVVERQLNKEGKTRYDLGREKFLEKVNDFAEKSKVIIRNQVKATGASLDWSREKFTLDEDLSRAVRTAFKKMYDDGLIYRGDRVVNWCPKCQTTLADDEVEYQEVQGKLYYIKYGPITIATTRPETKLGDTGVAVSLKDKRYKDLIGRELNVDLAGHKIKVKVFADRSVDQDFGTGAIGVTPAHSHQDADWAEKYGLDSIKVIDEKGQMTEKAGKYQSLSVLECRKQFINDLEKVGLLEKVEDYTNNLSICYRCNIPIEPLSSKQWFVDVNKKIPGRSKSLKELANEVVKKGDIKIIPDRFNKAYFQWMDNLRDWCISRQIWYGHQIPVWYCGGSQKKMGFHEKVIPQLYKGKTKTYRLRDHQFKVGDEVAFENSQIGEIFGQGKIINIEKTVVGKIYLQDKAHGTTYKTVEELIKAFKKHHPDLEVTPKAKVIIYTYEFKPSKSVEKDNNIIVPKNITQLFLMRHGVTDWNKEQKLQGSTNVPLDESSIEQIQKVMPKLKSEQFDLIITSSLMRAKQTAEVINQGLRLPLEINDLLKERGYGEFEGRKVKDLKKEHPNYFKNKISYDIPGDEESYKELSQRVEKFIQETDKKHPNKKILVICHNAVMRTFKMVVEGWSVEKLSNYKPDFNQLEHYKILDGNFKLVNYQQDPDTLDTWFSSALWTFSTLGWLASVKTSAGKPEKTGDLKTYYPTSVMETGYDILFFWVARMIIMSMYLLKEKPFDVVYLHGLVRTRSGEKMSKSKPETCIDPLDMIKKFGSDALKLSMIVGASPGNDLRLYEEKISGYRNFVNKLWNISRYILSSVKEVKRVKTEDLRPARHASGSVAGGPKTLADKWIVREFQQIVESTTKNIEEFKFSPAGEELYEFTWSKLADWYLEIAKIEGNASTGSAHSKDEILLYILERLLILWHPFCPFVTEVLWDEFRTKELLMIQSWPEAHNPKTITYKQIRRDFGLLQEIVTSIRNTRAENKIDPKKIYSCLIKSKKNKLIEENKAIIEGLAKVKITPRCVGLRIHLNEADIVLDIKQNNELVKNREKEITNLKRYIEIQEKKLNNNDFVNKAPETVIVKEREKLEQAKIKLDKLLS